MFCYSLTLSIVIISPVVHKITSQKLDCAFAATSIEIDYGYLDQSDVMPVGYFIVTKQDMYI